MESKSVNVVEESGEEAVSPLVVTGTGSPGRLDPGRIRQPAGADDAGTELAVVVGQSGQAGQHLFVSTLCSSCCGELWRASGRGDRGGHGGGYIEFH